MARFVWRIAKGGSAKRYCWDTDNRVFAARSKCPGGGPPREKPKRKRGKKGAAPSKRFVWKTKGNKRRCFDTVRGAWAPVAKCRTKRRFGRFGWRKVCWNFDREEMAAMWSCKKPARRGVPKHGSRYCLQPDTPLPGGTVLVGKCWDRQGEKNVAANMCGRGADLCRD